MAYDDLKKQMNDDARTQMASMRENFSFARPPRDMGPQKIEPEGEAGNLAFTASPAEEAAPEAPTTPATGPLDLPDLSIEQMKAMRSVGDLLKGRGFISDSVYQAMMDPSDGTEG
ncbi:MAG: hypothetical protein P1V36_00155 [Planctomycetota bacterium]|nr:hypothetical protein [Planctomycetota bacterium]